MHQPKAIWVICGADWNRMYIRACLSSVNESMYIYSRTQNYSCKLFEIFFFLFFLLIFPLFECFIALWYFIIYLVDFRSSRIFVSTIQFVTNWIKYKVCDYFCKRLYMFLASGNDFVHVSTRVPTKLNFRHPIEGADHGWRVWTITVVVASSKSLSATLSRISSLF